MTEAANTTTLSVKNMVCDRCKAAVRRIVEAAGLRPTRVELGLVDVLGTPDGDTLRRLQAALRAEGFELLADRREQTVDRVRSLIVELVHRQDGQPPQRLSDYLSGQLHSDYSALSKLFSELTGSTVESYYVRQRVERVKELLSYGELSLSQIAVRMGYSSTAYLSAQFKQVTGITPSAFKASSGQGRRTLDSL